jgi:alpha-N-acetylglucosaminidase
MFYSDGDFWQREQIEAFVTGPPQDKLVIIDLYAEEHPIWADTDSFFGQPFIYSTIFNFGGRSGMFGRPTTVTQGITDALENAESIVGLGAAPEAIEQNPVNYDFLWDHVFNTEEKDVDDFFKKYVNRRYKTGVDAAGEKLQAAWRLLQTSVYQADQPSGMRGAVVSVFMERPRLGLAGVQDLIP